MWYFISKEYTPIQDLDIKMKELFLVIYCFFKFFIKPMQLCKYKYLEIFRKVK